MENKNFIEKDILVIGAGPAGLFSIFEAGMLKMTCAVIDNLQFVGGQCTALYPEKPIYDIPAFPKILAKDLIKNLEDQSSPFKASYFLSQQAEKLETKDGFFYVTTSKNNLIKAKVIIIAAGSGSFGPNKPPLENIESFEENSIFYSVYNPEQFRGKNIVIAGGGDSAIDWAINLANIAKSIKIVHRRDKFRALPESVSQIEQLVSEGKIELVTPYQLHSLEGDKGTLQKVNVIDLNNNVKSLDAEILLPFFGLSMNLGPIKDWDLALNKHHIEVNAATMETNIPGIFAIGDIAYYPGKLKLILNGFGEAAMAAHNAYKIVHPDRALHFEYSTSKGVESL